jgi:hypothetical protein
MNQCTGCQRGLPITELGMHHDDSGIFVCTRARYRLELEPKTADSFRKPQREAAPFTFDGDVV